MSEVFLPVTAELAALDARLKAAAEASQAAQKDARQLSPVDYARAKADLIQRTAGIRYRQLPAEADARTMPREEYRRTLMGLGVRTYV